MRYNARVTFTPVPYGALYSTAILIAVLLNGCGHFDEPSAVPQSLARDSAGVTIVENAAPILTANAKRLSSAPRLVIGNESREQYQFGQVAGVARLSNAGFVVADGGSKQLRFFDSAGVFLRSAGREGSGPGEFRDLEMFARLAGDTLLAGGYAAQQSYFTGNGRYLRELPQLVLSGEPGTSKDPRLILLVLDDQTRIMIPYPRPVPPGPDIQRWVYAMPIFAVDPALAQPPRHVADLPLFSAAMDHGQPSQVWLSPSASYARSGRTFYWGFGNEYSITQHGSDGRVQRIIRRKWTPVKITQQDIDAFVEEWSKRWIKPTEPRAAEQKKDLQDDLYADTIPAFAQIIVDRTNGIWVREAHLADAARAGSLSGVPLVESTWSVFDASGRWLFDVSMPPNFMPWDIGPDFVLGVARDGDGVETIVLYGLEASSR